MALSELYLWFIALASFGLIWRDVRTVLLPKLRNESGFQHFTFAVVAALAMLWSAQAGVKAGLSIHFLGLTTLTLLYGWRSAYAIGLFAALAVTLFSELPLTMLPSYLLFSVLCPIVISHGVFLVSYRFLPRNIFVFIFVAGFLNGAVTGSAHLLINAVHHWWLGPHDWPTIVDHYLVFLPLLAFPEGLLNGMAAAMFAVFKPEWLRVFSDSDYIYNHYHKK